MKNSQITITINGKSHSFQADDKDAIKQIKWQDRKDLIALLEQVKQVEYVNNSKPKVDSAIEQLSDIQEGSQPKKTELEPTGKMDKTDHKDHTASKPVDGDPDQLMQHFLMQQGGQNNIPSSKDVYKWMLIIFVVIIILAFIF